MRNELEQIEASVAKVLADMYPGNEVVRYSIAEAAPSPYGVFVRGANGLEVEVTIFKK